jgi:hypothetical protein
VLAVVQGQQQPAAPQDIGQGLQQGAPGLFADPQNRRDTGDDQVGLAQVGQLDEPCPVGELSRDRGQQPQRQPGFADASGPAQGQRPRRVHQAAQLIEFVLTADEAVRFFGQLGLNLDYLISAERGANMPRVNLSPRSGDALSQAERGHAASPNSPTTAAGRTSITVCPAPAAVIGSQVDLALRPPVDPSEREVVRVT